MTSLSVAHARATLVAVLLQGGRIEAVNVAAPVPGEEMTVPGEMTVAATGEAPGGVSRGLSAVPTVGLEAGRIGTRSEGARC